VRQIVGIAALCLLAAGVGAQTRERFVVFSNANSTQPTDIYQIDETGQLISTVVSFPANTIPQGLVLGADNQTLLMPDFTFQNLNFVGRVYSVTLSGVVRTIALGGALDRPWHLVRDSDGDWMVLDAAELGQRMTKVVRMSDQGVTTLQSISPGLGYSGARDEDSGQLFLRGAVGLDIGYLRIDPANGTVTSFWMSAKSRNFWAGYGAREPVFEGPTGAFIDVPWDNGMWLSRFHPEIGRHDISPTKISTVPVDMVAADQQASPVYYVLGRSISPPYGYHLLHMTAGGTEIRRYAVQTPPLHPRTPLVRLGSRHLSWHMSRPPNGRSLWLSFLTLPGRKYAVAFSSTGVRPGRQLIDGRVIPIVLDQLALTCLQGGIPGVIENTVGTLDTAGRAQVKVDTNAFRGVLKGRRFWATAVVLDPAATLGIAYIVGPTLLEIRQ